MIYSRLEEREEEEIWKHEVWSTWRNDKIRFCEHYSQGDNAALDARKNYEETKIEK